MPGITSNHHSTEDFVRECGDADVAEALASIALRVSSVDEHDEHDEALLTPKTGF